MKPPVFEYYDPRNLHEALDWLAQLGEDAKVLAGGQCAEAIHERFHLKKAGLSGGD
ncbi:MAG: hypothetical protein ACE10H_15460 [Candidatus Binatia bacterium]